MYETPVINTRRIRRPHDSEPVLDAADAPVPAPAPAPSTRGAFGSSAYRSASAIIASPSSIARLTPEAPSGLPAKRARSRTPTSTAKIAASASAMVSAGSGDAPADP